MARVSPWVGNFFKMVSTVGRCGVVVVVVRG